MDLLNKVLEAEKAERTKLAKEKSAVVKEEQKSILASETGAYTTFQQAIITRESGGKLIKDPQNPWYIPTIPEEIVDPTTGEISAEQRPLKPEEYKTFIFQKLEEEKQNILRTGLSDIRKRLDADIQQHIQKGESLPEDIAKRYALETIGLLNFTDTAVTDIPAAQTILYWADNATKITKVEELNRLREGEFTLQMLAQGVDPKEIQAELGGAEIPIVDPVEFLVGQGLALKFAGAAAGGVKELLTALFNPQTSKAAAKMLALEMGEQFLQDTAITGTLFTLNEFVDMNPVLKALSGVIGSVGVGFLTSLSYRSMALWIYNIRKTNPKIYAEIDEIVRQHDDALSRTLREFIDDPDSVEALIRADEAAAHAENAGLQLQIPKAVQDLLEASRNRLRGALDRAAEMHAEGLLSDETYQEIMKSAEGMGEFAKTFFVPNRLNTGRARVMQKVVEVDGKKGILLDTDTEEIQLKEIRLPKKGEQGITESINTIYSDTAQVQFPDGSVKQVPLEKVKVTDTKLPDIKPTLEGPVVRYKAPFANQMKNAAMVGDAIGNETLLEMERVRQMSDVIRVRLSPDRAFSLGTDSALEVKAGELTRKAGAHWWASPSTFFRRMKDGLVTVPWLSELEKRRMMQGIKKGYKIIFGGLNKKQLSKLNRLIAESDELEEVFTLKEGGLYNSRGEFYTADPDLIERYFAYRMLDDHLGNILNESRRRILKDSGWKLYGTDIVKPIKAGVGQTDDFGLTMTREMKDAGYQAVKLQDGRTQFLDPTEASKVVEIPDGYRVIGNRKGHMARIYKDPWAVVEVAKKGDKWIVRRKELGDTYNIVEKRVKELNAKVEGTEDETFYFAAKRNSLINGLETAMARRSIKFLNTLTDEELQALRRELEAAGVADDIVEAITTTSQLTRPRGTAHARKRGERLTKVGGVEPAEILPADQALIKYASSVLNYTTTAHYVQALKTQFAKEFRPVLHADGWSIRKVGPSGEPLSPALIDMAQEAQLVQDQISRIARLPTFSEIANTEAFNALAQRMFSSKYYKPIAGTVIDKAVTRLLNDVSVHKIARATQSITAQLTLGLFNISQAVVQTTSLLNISALLPKRGGASAIAGGARDFLKAITVGILGDKIQANGEATRLWQALRQSGFIAEVDFDDIRRLAGDGFLANSPWRKLVLAGQMPFKAGEGVQRGVIWMAVRRQMIEEIKAGKSAFKVAEIDTQKFLDAVSAEAQKYALNLSYLDKPRIMQNPLMGIMLQFKQYPIKQLELMLGKELSSAQKFFLWTTWGTAFGIEGFPFMGDLFEGISKIEAKLKEDPSQIEDTRTAVAKWFGETITDAINQRFVKLDPERKETLQKFFGDLMSKGIIYATDNDLDIATRAGIGSLIDRRVASMSPLELVGGASFGWISAALAGTAHLVQNAMGKNSPSALVDLVKVLQTGEWSDTTIPELTGPLKEIFQRVSSARNMLMAIEGAATGEIRDVRGNVLVQEPTFKELVLQFMGIAPGRVNEARKEQNLARAIKQAWKEWAFDKADHVAKRFIDGDVEYGTILLRQYLNQLKESNPQLMIPFVQLVNKSILNKNISIDDRAVLDAVKHTMVPPDQLPFLFQE